LRCLTPAPFSDGLAPYTASQPEEVAVDCSESHLNRTPPGPSNWTHPRSRTRNFGIERGNFEVLACAGLLVGALAETYAVSTRASRERATHQSTGVMRNSLDVRAANVRTEASREYYNDADGN